jgi:subtilisin family serine protease
MTYRNKLLLVAMLATALLSACAGKFPSLQADETPKQFAARQVIVALSEDLREQWPSIDREIQLRYGIAKAGEFPLTSIRVNCLVYRIAEQGSPGQVPEYRPPDQIIQALSTDGRIQLAERNQIFETLQTGDTDPYADMEYGLQVTGAQLAHQISTGKDVSIAVIDTGVDWNHPDLKERIAKTENFVEGGDAHFSEESHGTAVAGIIAAQANNGVGIHGIAPDSKLTALKACWYADPASPKASCAGWTLAKAIDFAINANIRVINLSLNGPPDELLKKLLEVAYKKGIVVVAAAAEDKPQPGFPASLPTVIPVISSDARGRIAHPSWLSQLSPVAAPGVDILTTTPHAGYNFLSGSSLATAHISGIVALLLQRQPNLTPDEVRQILVQTGYVGPSSAQPPQAPLVNACRALASNANGLACP